MRSIELGWLARKDKSTPLTDIEFVEYPETNWSGIYYRPGIYTQVDGDKVSYPRGVIFINFSHCDIQNPASIIAHEWRHHWQYNRGETFDGIISVDSFDFSYENYEKSSYEYYTKMHFEFDALRFQNSVVEDEISKYQLDIALNYGKRK